MTELVQVEAEERPCRDPECSGIAEPEIDGSHRYWECIECGFCFNYERVDLAVAEGDACAIGVPEELRRRMSAGMEQAMAAEQRAAPVVVQLGKKGQK